MLNVAHLSKDYPAPGGSLSVLSDVSFSLDAGDAVAIMGPSGSGKSSLLYVLGALEPPSSGTVTLDGRDPFQLSGGERQRVAVARALVRAPQLLLCDEPTGNLDRASADQVAALLLDLHRQQQCILVVVTHNAELAARFPIRFELRDRQLHRV